MSKPGESVSDTQVRKAYFEQHPAHPDRYIHKTEHVDVRVEDDRTGMSPEAFKRAFADHLYYNQGVDENTATLHDYYMALAYTVRDRLMHRWIKSHQAFMEQDAKTVFYLSAEFLMGRQLGNNLLNVGCFSQAREALREFRLEIYDLIEQEAEPGLGNGGLGRLAACFLDSLATLEYPAFGYGIRYEFGIFEQRFDGGWQVEHPDKWLRWGNPWEIARPQHTVEVAFGGHTESYRDEQGRERSKWIPFRSVLGTPYDTLIPGFNTNTVNTLRLWSAGTSKEFDFQIFDSGDYYKAVEEKTFSENISKVLYPNDNTPQGRELRLRQQHFFVSCALQDIVRRYLLNHSTFDDFDKKNAIQLNDTHPAIAVAELMRLLMDEHALDWEPAWEITHNTLGYTNHTLLPEALEKWSVRLFRWLLPRHLEIIFGINDRFLKKISEVYPGDPSRIARMSLIEEGQEKQVRMANLAVVGSHAVNGVAKLHSDLVKDKVLHDFYELWPERFSNKTNGVTPRRWLMLSNPKLTYLISEKIGKSWIKNSEELRGLEKYLEDPLFIETWKIFKDENKSDLAEVIKHLCGVRVDSSSLFDIQVKRLHEYKRQLLNVLHIITLYNRLKKSPGADIVPRTFVFGAKAAPGYFMAKLIIKLINSIGEVLNNDRDIDGRLKVVFLPNFSVSLGERVYPAADLSEQISLAGKEASGTGNMKFALNGALTIGTLDGANIEIRDAVGAENFFLFGMTVTEVEELRARGYQPLAYYQSDIELKEVIDAISSGVFSQGDKAVFRPIVDSLLNRDEYFLLADYRSYINCQDEVSRVFRDGDRWARMSVLNTARSGHFSSDRTIREYASEIWGLRPVSFSIENYDQDKATNRKSNKQKGADSGK
jgi:starch phosphorylase